MNDNPALLRLQPLAANPGGLSGNASRILDAARRAAADGISVLAVPAESLAPLPGSLLLPESSPDAPRLAARARDAIPGLLASLPPSIRLAGLDGLPDPPSLPFTLDASTRPFRTFPLSAPPPASPRPLARVNLLGACDSLVCDGSAAVFAPDGSPIAANRPFSGAPLDIALDAGTLRPLSPPIPEPSSAALLWDALVLAIRDYADKNRFPGAFVSLSGGIDSAVVATLAVDALGSSRVSAATFPSSVTSSETLSDALELARRLSIPCPVIPIAPAFDLLSSLLPPPSAYPLPPLPGTLLEENLQSRIRGLLVMALSNRHGHLVLATGNRSEGLTGYCTLYGDTCGGFAPIRDVLKTEVFALAKYRNSLTPSAPPIPQSTIDRPPSAELRPGQRDSDSLPPYPDLDPLLAALVDRALPPADAATAANLSLETALRVAKLLSRSEYKRRQTPIGPSLRPPARLPATPLPA